MDYLDYPNLEESHIDFLIERLALKKGLLEIKYEFEAVYDNRKIKAEAIQKLQKDKSAEIQEKRDFLLTSGVETIPLSHSYTVMSLAQSRIESLLKNPKTVRQNRRIGNDGKEFFEDEKEIDDKTIQDYIKIAQTERFNYLKLEIEKVTKDVDKNRLTGKREGFKPVTIDSGFNTKEDAKTQEVE